MAAPLLFKPPVEMRLLIACGRAAVLRRQPEAGELVPSGAAINWPLAVRLARAHGLLAPLYRGLCAAPDLAPPAVMRELRMQAAAGAMRVEHLVRELLDLLDRFNDAGIAAIPFKGPLLSWLAYDDPAMRQFVDFDILVHREDVPRAAAMLAAAGYAPRTFDPARFASGFFRDSADEFAAAGRMAVIDLHWKIMAWYFPFAPPESELWARSRRVEFAGVELTALAPEDLILVLAVHAAKHGWCSVGQAAEIAGLLHCAGELSWDAMLARASHRASRRMLLIAVWLAHEMFLAPVPAAVMAAVEADPETISLARQILWRFNVRPEFKPGVFHRWIVPLRTIERASSRARFFLDLALSPTGGDGVAIALPRVLYPLYYVLRPLRLAGRKSRELSRAAGAALFSPAGTERD